MAETAPDTLMSTPARARLIRPARALLRPAPTGGILAGDMSTQHTDGPHHTGAPTPPHPDTADPQPPYPPSIVGAVERARLRGRALAGKIAREVAKYSTGFVVLPMLYSLAACAGLDGVTGMLDQAMGRSGAAVQAAGGVPQTWTDLHDDFAAIRDDLKPHARAAAAAAKAESEALAITEAMREQARQHLEAMTTEMAARQAAEDRAAAAEAQVEALRAASLAEICATINPVALSTFCDPINAATGAADKGAAPEVDATPAPATN